MKPAGPDEDYWRLNQRFELEVLASNLSASEAKECFDLSVQVAAEAQKFLEAKVPKDSECLGLICATSVPRNYFFSLMTAGAVKDYRQANRKSATVVELGLGSGILSLTALLIDKDSKVIAYEKNPYCVCFADSQFRLFGARDRIDIRKENFLKANMNGVVADIVINENIDSRPYYEPQFPAANKILPCTHKGSLFVPGGLDLFFEPCGNRKARTRASSIYFSNPVPNPIVLEGIFSSEQLWDESKRSPEGIAVIYSCDILNHRGETVFSPDFDNSGIRHFGLQPLPLYVITRGTDPNSQYKLRIALDYVRKTRIPLGNVHLIRM